MRMDGTQLRCLPLSLASSPPSYPISFPAPVASLSSDGHTVGQREWNRRQSTFFHTFFSFCLLLTKCWCTPQNYLLCTWICTQILLILCSWYIPWAISFLPYSCQCSNPSRNRTSQGIKLFSETIVYVKYSYTSWWEQLSTEPTAAAAEQ